MRGLSLAVLKSDWHQVEVNVFCGHAALHIALPKRSA
jgi:hypothetical protein